MANKKKEGFNTLFDDQYNHDKAGKNVKSVSKSNVTDTNNSKHGLSKTKSSNHSSDKSQSVDHKKKSSKAINPVWNVQLGIDQVAELNAIQSLKKLSSRTDALKMLLDFAKENSFLKDQSEKSLFKSSVTLFLHQHKDKAIKQYRKYHEK